MIRAHGRALPLAQRALILVLFLVCWQFANPAAAGTFDSNLVVNGNFKDDLKGWTGLRLHNGAEVRHEGGSSSLVISRSGGVTQRIALDPQWASLGVKMRMRVANVVMGKEGYNDARLAMSFNDARHKHLPPWPNVFHAAGSGDWIRYQRTFKIPEGAAELELSPSMLGASGTAEFADIEVTVARTQSGEMTDLPAPAAAGDVGDLTRAWRRSSPLRETSCLNDLWRFMPVLHGQHADAPPPVNHGWGWFKVPGMWPAGTDAAQQFLLAEELDSVEQRDLDQAWYQRPLTIPADWAGWRISLDFTMVHTHARVLIDGQPAGEVLFPGGQVDITAQVHPGTAQTLAILLTARPLEKESNVFMAPDRVLTNKASLRRKGLTGDVFLVSQPKSQALADVHVITSTRKGSIAFDVAIDALAAGPRILEAQIFDGATLVKTVRGEPFEASALKDGHIGFGGAWPDARRWDTNTPGNVYTAVVSLRDGSGKLLDQSLPITFGFREFWIDGRDFYLNGTPIHLRPLVATNITSEADQASLEASRNTCRRLKDYGFNSLITSAYNFEPGVVGYMDGLFQASDEEGILASFSLPHIKDFGELDQPASAKRYHDFCQWLIRRAENHPSVVLYAMNHNATGYKGDENPLWMDGVYAPDPEWAATSPKKNAVKNRKNALIAGAIASELDPTRPVYHHESGNLGQMYTVNIYLNWAPLQERSDWLEHWSTAGVKPMFFVEWGLPHVASWSSFRGPAFIWRNEAFQQIWDSEFAAPYVGQQAYRMTPTKVRSQQWEEESWAKGKPLFWSSLIKYFRSQDENYTQVQALFAADNWRSHRTWGISAMLPWDQENFWRLPEEAGPHVPATQPFKDLQQPGIVADQIAPVGNEYIYSRDVSKIKPSVLGQTFLRWNMPLCAYIAGQREHFTEKGHDFRAGETVQKQLAILNDTRRGVVCRYSWALAGTALAGQGQAPIAAGKKAMIPLKLALPADLAAGQRMLTARFDFGAGGVQEDSFALDVLPAPAAYRPANRLAIYDPRGDTTKLLQSLAITARPVGATDSLDGTDVLIIGRRALTADGPLTGFDRVANGLKILVFEQDADTLEQRLGFRINIQGQRQLYIRAPGHPALAGLGAAQLRDWRGAATIVPPYLDIRSIDDNDPKWKWSGFENARVWRCGNSGSVATVLIEKPDRGDFLPILDGGFDLQYSPLMEYAQGQGRIIFCQLDVTARTAGEPAGATLCQNLLHYLEAAKPAPARQVVCAGDARTSDLLSQLGIPTGGIDKLADGGLLVLGPGGQAPADLRHRVESGLNVLCLGLGESEIDRAFPGLLKFKTGPMVSTMLPAFDGPLLAGISNAELHWRTAPALTAILGADKSADALRVMPMGRGSVIFCQAAPWMFDCVKQPYLRTTSRRSTFLVARLLHNLGAPGAALFGRAESLYLQTPVAGDDPYRYYRW